ncbi:rab-GTPase-TBC domain-containing protein [Biscogniauxia marginata]|nr:rab-GTPase-TBC domain-containing protein [Biscogniauxia marginata]
MASEDVLPQHVDDTDEGVKEEHEEHEEKVDEVKEEQGADQDTPAALAEEQALILDACERRDIDDLGRLALLRGGFLSDAIRCRAWPVLLGFEVDKLGDPVEEGSDSWRQLPRHRDEDQVKLDVDRSFVYYPSDNTPEQLALKKTELLDLITEVLRRQPYLCYFQGYHDICQVILLVLPPAARAPAMSRLSALRIRDFMLPNLAPAIAQLRLIPDILRAADPALWRHLSRVEPYFALADTLTMFAHNVPRYGDISRLFDALLAREQVFGLYAFAAIVLSRRPELFALDPVDDADMLHFTLSKLPAELDLEAVISDAARLLADHPPESLPSWRRVSRASVLRTDRGGAAACRSQTLDDGHAFFDRQLSELRWAERRDALLRVAWSNRAVILAVLVGVGAVYLRRTSFWTAIVDTVWRGVARGTGTVDG